MNTILKAGLALGVLVSVWTLVMGYTGWYKDPAMLNLFWIVIPIEIAVLWWALRERAGAGRSYGGLVLDGLLVSLIGSVLILGGSLLFTNVLFPRYFEELAAIQGRMLAEAGRSPEEISAALEAYRKGATPLVNALQGFLGTVATGLLGSVIIGAIVRRK